MWYDVTPDTAIFFLIVLTAWTLFLKLDYIHIFFYHADSCLWGLGTLVCKHFFQSLTFYRFLRKIHTHSTTEEIYLTIYTLYFKFPKGKRRTSIIMISRNSLHKLHKCMALSRYMEAIFQEIKHWSYVQRQDTPEASIILIGQKGKWFISMHFYRTLVSNCCLVSIHHVKYVKNYGSQQNAMSPFSLQFLWKRICRRNIQNWNCAGFKT